MQVAPKIGLEADALSKDCLNKIFHSLDEVCVWWYHDGVFIMMLVFRYGVVFSQDDDTYLSIENFDRFVDVCKTVHEVSCFGCG